MDKARNVWCQVLYDGQEVGLSTILESLSYTDNSSGVSDEINLVFSGRNADWLRRSFTPEKGHDLDVTIWLSNWKKQGDRLRYHCGNFTLDDLTYSGTPGRCVIRGVSVPAEESFQTSPVSKTWEKVTLKQIAQEMITKYGMRELYYHGEEPVMEKVEQSGQADSEFLRELCERQGMFLKVYKKDIIIFDKITYETKGTVADFREKDMEEWSWNTTLNGTYTGATIAYTIPEKKKTIETTIGQGPRLLYINERADSEGDALRIARSKVNSANEKAATISFTAMANPDVVATCNIGIYGLGRCNGKYSVDKVKHRVTGTGGYTMSVSGYRIFDRL